MQRIAIIDYGAGNLRSVQKAFEHLGHTAEFVTGASGIASADALVFPGQGASPPAMARLIESGLVEPIKAAVASGKPFFGVCLGLQLLLDWSEEGDTHCLGIVPGRVQRFGEGLKVPHMGWNAVHLRHEHPVFHGIPQDSYFYFVHSYYGAPADPSWVEGVTSYGVDFASVLAKDNVVATQFHPEKSGGLGLQLYDNFVKLFATQRTG